VDELSAVRDSGADYGQGFLLARPGYPPPDIYWPF
jgi:EAL domain-containing protein (putative c-di-GMP-specific phosphodiesterase class I)